MHSHDAGFLPRDRKWCFTRLFLIFYESSFLGMSSSIERIFGFRCAVERMTLPLRMALPLTKSLGRYLAATCIYFYTWQCTWQRGLELLLSTSLGTRFARFSYEFSRLSVIVQRFMMQVDCDHTANVYRGLRLCQIPRDARWKQLDAQYVFREFGKKSLR